MEDGVCHGGSGGRNPDFSRAAGTSFAPDPVAVDRYTFSGTTKGDRYARVNMWFASASPLQVMVAASK
jgi:hypothetical protein